MKLFILYGRSEQRFLFRETRDLSERILNIRMQHLVKGAISMDKACKDDWVEISSIVLQTGERSQQIPAETAAVPYVLRCRGFACDAAVVGEKIEITTLAGRTLGGTLVSVRPSFNHGFGECVPQLMETRRRLNRRNGN